MMNSLLDKFIEQPDTLIPFIALSEEEVFNLLDEKKTVWFSDFSDAMPEAYDIYCKQVNHAAFLLGYSYFESFLMDLVSGILRDRPNMLPKNKQLKYSEILSCKDLNQTIDQMINKEIRDLFYKSMEDIVKELKDKYNFTISDEEKNELCEMSLVRNCIMHNSSQADSRLASFDGFKDGLSFELSSSKIHQYGWMIRDLTQKMVDEENN
jgi:hypothetical protein